MRHFSTIESIPASEALDWYPLWNSLRIAAISSFLVFFAGIFAAYDAVRLPRAIKGLPDVILTLPLVLRLRVCGYFLLILVGNRRPPGIFPARFGIKFAMTWYVEAVRMRFLQPCEKFSTKKYPPISRRVGRVMIVAVFSVLYNFSVETVTLIW